jgi:hypothetical protein
LEPVRLNFAPTSHDPLAQSPGKFTFHFDADHGLWECLGTKETGAETFVFSGNTKLARADDVPAAWEEIGRDGIESDQPLRWTMRPIMARDGRSRSGPASLPPGEYRLRLLLVDPSSTAPGQRVFDVSVACGSELEEYTFDPAPAKFLRLLCQGNSENDWNSLVEVRLDSLTASDGVPAVSAGAAVEGYPPTAVLDRDPNTRWAARGTGQWLRFRLAPGALPHSIGLQWYAAEKRQARFEVQVSDDGLAWSPVKNLRRKAVDPRLAERLDIVQQAGEANKIIARTYELSVGSGGMVEVKLTPVQGKAIVCGAGLEPLAERPRAR